MANYTYFYTIGFYDKEGNGVDRDIVSFLDKIEARIREDDVRIVRSINKEFLRMFLFLRDLMNDDIVVVPLGKLITKNKPYAEDRNNPGKLIQLDADMFDINCMVYSKRHHLAMYTTNSKGPSQQEFCAYLNSYLFEEDGCILKMNPVLFEKSLEDIRSAERVTSILVSVDLRDNINNYFREQVEHNINLLTLVRNMMDVSKETVDGRYLTFSIGLGQGKRTGTLNKDSVLTLLGQLNLDSRFFKQIELKYEDKRTDKIESFKIKNTDTFLRGVFIGANSKLSPDFLLDHAGEVYLKQREHFISSVQNFVNNIKKEANEDYELNLDWGEDE